MRMHQDGVSGDGRMWVTKGSAVLIIVDFKQSFLAVLNSCCVRCEGNLICHMLIVVSCRIFLTKVVVLCIIRLCCVLSWICIPILSLVSAAELLQLLPASCTVMLFGCLVSELL